MSKLKFKAQLVVKMRLKAWWLRTVARRRDPGVAYHPFLLTGPPRSGTSLLTNLLGRKRNVLIANEPLVCGDPLMKRGRPVDLIHGYLNDMARLAVRDGRMWTQVDPEEQSKATTDTANRGAVRRQVDVDLDPNQPLCLGMKHPMPFMECLEPLLSEWPDLRILLTIRDPHSTIRSWRETTYGWQPGLDDPRFRHGRALYDMVPATDDQLERRAHLWRLLVERAEDCAARFPQQLLVFRYEELLAEPAAVMQRLFAHIQAPSPDDPIDVADVKPQHRSKYRGLEPDEVQTITRICAEADARTAWTTPDVAVDEQVPS